jgi:hypothetical protein
MSIEDNHRWPRPNHNYVPEYQMSGIPYAETKVCAKDATISFNFDYVTRWIIISTDKDIKLGFNHDNTIHGTYYFNIIAGTTERFELKCKKIVVTSTAEANVSVLAGFTNVLASTFPNQTLDNGFKVQ